jgi:hypothetical protein
MVEDEIFKKLQHVNTENFPGNAVRGLTTVGIFEFQRVLSSSPKRKMPA